MRTRITHVLLALGALVAAPGTAGALSGQDVTAQARARVVLPPEVYLEVERLGLSLEEEGIPAELVYSKALEGMAKRVPAGRIGPAVQAFAERLRVARGSFGALAGPPLLVAGADALQRGVSREALGELGRREDRSPMAVLVLAELVETGVPAERALEVVGEALRLRTREREMLGIPEGVRRLMRQGQTAQDAADQIRRSLRRGRGGGVGPPVPPGSEPLTDDRRREQRRRVGG